jgi:uncharacterized protein
LRRFNHRDGKRSENARKRGPAKAVVVRPHQRGKWFQPAVYVRTACAIALSLFAAQCLRAQPQVDYHQHLFSPKIAKLAPALNPLTAADLIALLDKAGIRRAVVLSIAYQYSSANRPPIEDEYAKVKEENDWTSQQVALYPKRLRGFCSVNPLKEYAIAEIERCSKDPQLHYGLKLHFGNSDVNLDNPEHVEKLKLVFHAANEHGMAIVVHMRASITKKRPYGDQQARIFLNNLLPAAPDVSVQIAHLAGAGSYDDPSIDEALSVFLDAIGKSDPRMTHVYFDVSGVAGYGEWEKKADLIANRIRQLGTKRILFGSDGFGGGNLAPVDAWTAFRRLPLSEGEFHAIETNTAPYMR